MSGGNQLEMLLKGHIGLLLICICLILKSLFETQTKHYFILGNHVKK